jgi:hypothetical protein
VAVLTDIEASGEGGVSAAGWRWGGAGAGSAEGAEKKGRKRSWRRRGRGGGAGAVTSDGGEEQRPATKVEEAVVAEGGGHAIALLLDGSHDWVVLPHSPTSYTSLN